MYQFKMLMHHADTQGIGIQGAFHFDFLPLYFDHALLRLVKSEENAHEGGLSRAVFSQQRVDLTLFQLNRNIIIGNDSRKLLCDVKHFNNIIHQVSPLFSGN
jgi:hypothetical protein